ncbi:chorismate synthase [Desulfocicer vacuolatum DSM 3385]|uniref:Chorismate synthase n=1 Tax=Desulfocicer vacuolatum DSM 3385 TaxID=1121400 RepID=A0A1W1ZKR8_9BACT|nr:chorismate synthase [Desulfocicer vacuolatum]SMC49145.1 chorismate synthase [Desulfocicer vacuolatum DSM 3385]
MAGSSFGKVFQVSTWGESHGPGLGVVVQGCPPGITLNEAVLQKALDKRKPGKGSTSTRRKEPDRAEILSGVFEGVTTGTPISIMIRNRDARSRDYHKNAAVFRPGHGDITYQAKYGVRDWRGGGRASARETAARVAAGAVAQAILDTHGIIIKSMTLALGGVAIDKMDTDPVTNRLECPDSVALEKMETRISYVKKQGDSLGGVVGVTAINAPAGLGDPVFDKLDADIAKALMSIGAVKAVEIGAGCRAATLTGYENNDPITVGGFASNNSGGILAGISNGDPIVARVHVKPIPSISKPQQTVDQDGGETTLSTTGRHDISAIPRINPVCRAMLALVIADHLLRQRCV